MDLFTGYYSFYVPYKLFMEDKCFLEMKIFETLTHPIITESFAVENSFHFLVTCNFPKGQEKYHRRQPFETNLSP